MQKIQANMILEIMGRPAVNVQEGLKALISKLGGEKGVQILEQTLHEPLPLKDSKDLFTAFAEIMVELDTLDNYFGVIFAYMPSNIEIISPEKIVLANEHFNSLGNRILLRMHDYDAITKKMIYDRDIALGKLKEVAPHLFKEEVKQLNQSNQSPSAAEPKKAAKKSSGKKVKKK